MYHFLNMITLQSESEDGSGTATATLGIKAATAAATAVKNIMAPVRSYMFYLICIPLTQTHLSFCELYSLRMVLVLLLPLVLMLLLLLKI